MIQGQVVITGGQFTQVSQDNRRLDKGKLLSRAQGSSAHRLVFYLVLTCSYQDIISENLSRRISQCR